MPDPKTDTEIDASFGLDNLGAWNAGGEAARLMRDDGALGSDILNGTMRLFAGGPPPLSLAQREARQEARKGARPPVKGR